MIAQDGRLSVGQKVGLGAEKGGMGGKKGRRIEAVDHGGRSERMLPGQGLHGRNGLRQSSGRRGVKRSAVRSRIRTDIRSVSNGGERRPTEVETARCWRRRPEIGVRVASAFAVRFGRRRDARTSAAAAGVAVVAVVQGVFALAVDAVQKELGDGFAGDECVLVGDLRRRESSLCLEDCQWIQSTKQK